MQSMATCNFIENNYAFLREWQKADANKERRIFE
jgi:hypothetical protein